MEMTEIELEKQLLDAGNKLLSPPSLTSELLESLNLLETLLLEVEQSPSESTREALAPSTKALIAEELLRHSDTDVKVAVASCISEITRITAPDAPYADDEMKEVFHLIVSCFERLDDKSSRSYIKRISILEILAGVRSCVVMLDLECDDLIVEMFRHFLATIRNDHHEGVFTSMETIMTLVLEESEAISVDLLSSILNILKKEDKEVLPIARLLAEKVIVNCASKVKPYLLSAVRSIGSSLDDYSKAVADICQAGDEAVEPTDDVTNEHSAAANDLLNAPSEKAVELGDTSVQSFDKEDIDVRNLLEISSTFQKLEGQDELKDRPDIAGHQKSAEVSCAICWTEHSATRGVLPCGHRYCFSCIQEWADRMASNRKETTCPICKASFASIIRVDATASLDQKIYSQTVPWASSEDIFIVPEIRAIRSNTQIPLP